MRSSLVTVTVIVVCALLTGALVAQGAGKSTGRSAAAAQYKPDPCKSGGAGVRIAATREGSSKLCSDCEAAVQALKDLVDAATNAGTLGHPGQQAAINAKAQELVKKLAECQR